MYSITSSAILLKFPARVHMGVIGRRIGTQKKRVSEKEKRTNRRRN